MQAQNLFKSGYVSIIGEPNVGKSTLLNAIMGEKLAIVTPKPQTTRNRIPGILTTDSHQIIFLDTPGVLTPKYRLHDQMVKAAYSAITDADLVLYMIDASRLNSGIEEKILNELKKAAQQVILVINKIDLIPHPALLPIITNSQGKFPFVEIIPMSATTGDGVSQLHESIVKHLPEGPPYFPRTNSATYRSVSLSRKRYGRRFSSEPIRRSPTPPASWLKNSKNVQTERSTSARCFMSNDNRKKAFLLGKVVRQSKGLVNSLAQRSSGSWRQPSF